MIENDNGNGKTWKRKPFPTEYNRSANACVCATWGDKLTRSSTGHHRLCRRGVDGEKVDYHTPYEALAKFGPVAVPPANRSPKKTERKLG